MGPFFQLVNVNGGDRRRKVAFLLLALAAVMAVASAALAVVIALDPGDVADIGGTYPVDVECPTADPCQVDRVTWSISGPPFQVTAVNVEWTPRNSGSYTVFVVLYDSTVTIISSGSATVTVTAGSPTTTTVNVSPGASPRDIYYVEIVIVQN